MRLKVAAHRLRVLSDLPHLRFSSTFYLEVPRGSFLCTPNADVMGYPPQDNSSSSRGDTLLKPPPNSNYQASSHYHDLRQLEPEDDLIQLASRPATPRIETRNTEPIASEARLGGVDIEAEVRRKPVRSYER